MIIPIRCNCGRVLANLVEYYYKKAAVIDAEYENALLDKYNDDNSRSRVSDNTESKNKNKNKKEKTYKNIAPNYKNHLLDELHLTKQCCRVAMLSHVNMMGKI